MSNPARELHTLLGQWRGKEKGTLFQVRGTPNHNAATSNLWDSMLRAVHLLDETRRGLASLELLEPNRKMLDSIATTIFVPELAWSNQASARAATSEQMGSLATWARLLDGAQPQFTIEAADIEAAHEALSEARTALQSVPGIPEAHRVYIADLIDAAGELLAGERPDLLAARAKFHQALGAVMFEPAVRTSEQGQTLVNRFSRVGAIMFFAVVGIPVIQGIGTDVGSELILDYLRAPAAIEQSAEPESSAESDTTDD